MVKYFGEEIPQLETIYKGFNTYNRSLKDTLVSNPWLKLNDIRIKYSNTLHEADRVYKIAEQLIETKGNLSKKEAEELVPFVTKTIQEMDSTFYGEKNSVMNQIINKLQPEVKDKLLENKSKLDNAGIALASTRLGSAGIGFLTGYLLYSEIHPLLVIGAGIVSGIVPAIYTAIKIQNIKEKKLIEGIQNEAPKIYESIKENIPKVFEYLDPRVKFISRIENPRERLRKDIYQLAKNTIITDNPTTFISNLNEELANIDKYDFFEEVCQTYEELTGKKTKLMQLPEKAVFAASEIAKVFEVIAQTEEFHEQVKSYGNREFAYGAFDVNPRTMFIRKPNQLHEGIETIVNGVMGLVPESEHKFLDDYFSIKNKTLSKVK